VGASGTPTFIVGDQVFHGALPYEDLKKAVDEARARTS
jgi:protein-disulfide isomerase